MSRAVNEAQIARVIDRREAFGLRRDPDWVGRLEADPPDKSVLFDIALSPDEEAEMARRHELGLRSGAVDQAYADDDTFAGCWLDQRAGGELVVAFTTSGRLRTEFEHLLPADAPTRIEHVRVGLNKLREMHQRLSSELRSEFWRTERGTRIHSLALSLSTNSIVVGIAPDSRADAESLIAQEFGAVGLRVQRTAADALR